MWSNMRKKKLDSNVVPQSLIKDLERLEKEKQEFLNPGVTPPLVEPSPTSKDSEEAK